MSFLDDDRPTKAGDQHPISCRVSDGDIQGKGRSAKVDFLVTTKFANASDSLVRRTWEDFVWAQERLVQERAGIIVPVMPVKVAPSRKAEFEPDFIKERQAALDRFIQRIVMHQELVDAPSLLPFFTATVADLSAAKEAARLIDVATVEASNDSSVNDTGEEESKTVVISATEAIAPRRKGGFGQWFSQKRDQMALRSRYLVLEETPVESKRFDDMQSYADHLETCIQVLAEDSKLLTEAQRSTSERLKNMGAAFTQLWGEHELSTAHSSTLYQTLGVCWTGISKKIEHQSTFNAGNLDEPLQELALGVAALKATLAKRKKVVYEYTKLVKEGRKLQQRFDKLQSMANINETSDVYFVLEREIRRHDVTVEEKRKFKELITDRLTRDVARFLIEWHEHMRQVMERYHKEQAQLLLDKLKLWEGALPVIAKVDGTRSALPTSAKKAEVSEISFSVTTSGPSVSFGSGDNTNSPADTVADLLDLHAVSLNVPEVSDGAAFLANPSEPIFPDNLLEEIGALAPPPTSCPPPPPSCPPPVPPPDESIGGEEDNHHEMIIVSV